MKTLAVLSSFFMMTASAWAAESEQRVGDFTLLDQRGETHQMSLYNSRRGIVLLTSSSECPMSEEVAAGYSQINTRFSDLGFEFMILDISTSIELGSTVEKFGQHDLELPVLMDVGRTVSESLGVRKTDEVLVFDPKSFSVIYRGYVDGNLEVALFSILAGEEVMNSISSSSGCELVAGAGTN